MGDGDEIGCPSSDPADGYSVCAECFGDGDIQAFIRSNVDSDVCDFCGRRGRKGHVAAPLDDVVDGVIVPSIQREFEFAADCLGWDGAEGGYQGPHWDSWDLLVDHLQLDLPNDGGRLLDVLVECLGDQEWCERDPYSLRPGERLIASWDEFCDLVKHSRRYFFLQENRGQGDSDCLSPGELLQFIGEASEAHELVRTLAKGSLIYRARKTDAGQVLRSPLDFGAPAIEKALKSNRMSPAGIVMFYGSGESDTAVAEIDDDPRKGISVATFKTTRDARVLDLTQLPRRLGFFEQQSDCDDRDRYAIEFLHRFVGDLAKRVERGKKEYIDYVPTQIVTEWFRTVFRHGGEAIDGIRYGSAQRKGGRSLVLFADQGDIVLSPGQVKDAAQKLEIGEWQLELEHKNAWLKLVRTRDVRR